MADIVLISPRFEMSYWGLEHALPFMGRSANMPPAALPLLAALTPAGHTLTIMDENIAPIDFDRCARADIVGLTGMIVQRHRMTEILQALKTCGCSTVVGGPWVSVSEDYFGTLADTVFIGEAEETWPRFLEDWSRGAPARRYQQADKTDLSLLPTPRLDLLDLKRYAFGNVQFTRGCPFTCEFCDIIVLFGRRPRIKTVRQILAELDLLHRMGQEIVFIVDDNLIANKRAMRDILGPVIEWQRERDFPLTFFTEASLDLADEPDLMRLMVEANIVNVFVGIETPNEDSLRETKKLQNLRRGGTMVGKIHGIQNAGLEVWSGMILGFDNDDDTIFDAQLRFVSEARIVGSMVGMLNAIPTTPLHDRLAAEGRLDLDDEPAFGTNVIPKRLDRMVLRDGYLRILRDLSEPAAYFDRLDALYLDGPLSGDQGRTARLTGKPWLRRREQARFLVRATVMFARLMLWVREPDLRSEYRRRILHLARVNPRPALLFVYALRAAMHYHAWLLADRMSKSPAGVVNSY
ncbi:B12-binding domain-containing radical SAM protein [Skermanella stibiiresistens]|nr:B12-binding domain-containing radical SAM protein [Skermanella stibiiresistens]